MSLSDCPSCWETPCVCDDAKGYRHLSLNELRRIRLGISDIIIDKIREGAEPDKREQPK